MIISDKQQEANRQNARHSTGPNTPEGKAAVRLNALTYGLRARSTIITGENPEEYQQLWADLEADWQPRNRTERLHLETMATSQWLLARIARGESRAYEYLAIQFDDKHFALLQHFARQRVQLERSFRTAIEDLKQLQKERQARLQAQGSGPQDLRPETDSLQKERQARLQAQVQTAHAAEAQAAEAPVHKPAEPHVQPPAYVMSEGTEAHLPFCSTIAPDSR